MGDASERAGTGLYSLNDFVLHQHILRALHDGVVADLQDTLGLCYNAVLQLDQATRQLHFFSVPHDSCSSSGGRNNDESATPPLLTILLDPLVTTITCTETHLCVQTSALAGGSSATEMTLAIRPPHLIGTQDNTECSTGDAVPTTSAATQLQAWLTVLHRLQFVIVDTASPHISHSNATTTTSPRHSYTMRDAQEHGLPSMRDAPLTPTAMLRLLTTYQALLQSMAHFARDELRVVQGVLTQHPQSLTSNTTATTINCDETAHVATHSAEERINNGGEVHAERPATMAHRGLTALPLPLTLTHVTTPGEAPRYSPTHDLTPPHHGEVYTQDDLLTPLATRSSNSMTPAAATMTTTNNNSRPGSSYVFGGFSHIVHPLLTNSLHSSLRHRHRSRVHHSYHSPAPRTHSVPDRISSTRSSPAHPQPRPASAWSTHNTAQYPYHQHQQYYYPRWSAYSRSTHGSRPNGAQFNNSGSLGHLGPTHGDELALRVYQQIHGKPYRSAANSLSTLTTATTTTTTTMAAAAAAGADDEVEMGSATELPEADRVVCDENVVAPQHTTPQNDMRGSE